MRFAQKQKERIGRYIESYMNSNSILLDSLVYFHGNFNSSHSYKEPYPYSHDILPRRTSWLLGIMKIHVFESLLFLSNLTTLYAFPASDSTCSASKKCKVGCCSKFGSCGFGPDFCGPKVCIPGCDAKAECGSKYHINGIY